MSAFLLGTTIHDAETIDKLPLGAVVIQGAAPYQRIIDGDWYIAGSDNGTSSAELVRRGLVLLVWLPSEAMPRTAKLSEAKIRTLQNAEVGAVKRYGVTWLDEVTGRRVSSTACSLIRDGYGTPVPGDETTELRLTAKGVAALEAHSGVTR